jgi:hypothetical protein
MARSLIWVQSDADVGWACSSCQWRFPLPTLLSDKDARDAYDRLAASKFREHECKAQSVPAAPPKNMGPTLEERARMLIRSGYRPKVAVELVIEEIALEHRNDPRIMEKARRDAEDFLLKIRKGLI